VLLLQSYAHGYAHDYAHGYAHDYAHGYAHDYAHGYAHGLCLFAWLHVLHTLVCLFVIVPNPDGSSAVCVEHLIRAFCVWLVDFTHVPASRIHVFHSHAVDPQYAMWPKPDRQVMLKLQCCVLLVNTVLITCVQSFYEEQKREQMQGPALKRLEEEQQQQAQAPPLADDQWQDTQYTIGQDQQEPAHQPGLPFDESQLPFDQSNLPFDEATGQGDSQQGSLQLNGPRSWAGRRQSHQPHMPMRPASSEGLSLSMAGSFSGVSSGARGAKAHTSPKPPLPSRRQRTQSSEMAYLGGSAGASAGSGSDSDHV